MGRKKVTVFDINTLPEAEKELLIPCVCNSIPEFSHDPNKDKYLVKCTKPGCPGKAAHSDKMRALRRWKTTVSPAHNEY
jgi:hypothetical protein